MGKSFLSAEDWVCSIVGCYDDDLSFELKLFLVYIRINYSLWFRRCSSG
jgi:hypothetical protein